MNSGSLIGFSFVFWSHAILSKAILSKTWKYRLLRKSVKCKGRYGISRSIEAHIKDASPRDQHGFFLISGHQILETSTGSRLAAASLCKAYIYGEITSSSSHLKHSYSCQIQCLEWLGPNANHRDNLTCCLAIYQSLESILSLAPDSDLTLGSITSLRTLFSV